MLRGLLDEYDLSPKKVYKTFIELREQSKTNAVKSKTKHLGEVRAQPNTDGAGEQTGSGDRQG